MLDPRCSGGDRPVRRYEALSATLLGAGLGMLLVTVVFWVAMR